MSLTRVGNLRTIMVNLTCRNVMVPSQLRSNKIRGYQRANKECWEKSLKLNFQILTKRKTRRNLVPRVSHKVSTGVRVQMGLFVLSREKVHGSAKICRAFQKRSLKKTLKLQNKRPSCTLRALIILLTLRRANSQSLKAMQNPSMLGTMERNSRYMSNLSVWNQIKVLMTTNSLNLA